MATTSVFDTKYSPTKTTKSTTKSTAKSTANKLKPSGKGSATSLAKTVTNKTSTPTNKKGSTTSNKKSNLVKDIKTKSILSKTPSNAPKTKTSTFNLDAEVKKTMSGAYGSGAARKQALGANYSKVQAEINRRAAANKPKTSTAPKSTATTPAKSERVEIGSLPLKKVTEADLKPSPKPAAPVVKTSGGSGLGAKEKADKEMEKQGFRRGGSVKRRMMTGGMVNSNAKISAIKTPGSRGTKVGLNKRIAKPKGKRG